jgi:hypothetical protein
MSVLTAAQMMTRALELEAIVPRYRSATAAELGDACVRRVAGEIEAIASSPAFLMCPGVGKSGSPAEKSTTSSPCARRRIASAMTAIVGEVAI